VRIALSILVAIVLLSGCIQLPGQSQAGGASGQPSPGVGPAQQAQGGGSADSGASGGAGTDSAGTQSASGAASETPVDDSSATADGGDDASSGQQPSTSISSRDVSYKSGAWVIRGTLYGSTSKSPSRAVLLLPALGKTRESYPVSFIESLHEQMPDAVVLALDLRGHGESTNLGTYDNFDDSAFKEMKLDVLSAKPFLQKEYPSMKEFYVVGASIGSSVAIIASEQEKTFNKVVMISPGIEYRGLGIEDAAMDYPFDVLAAASTGDAYSVSSANTIKSIRSSRTIVKAYPGSAHGTDMFSSTEGGSDPLSAAIVEFLE